jgi:diguanylate cyclase
MKKLTNPSEIAREALKLLATRRIVPTPDHYRTIYNEIAGMDDSDQEIGKILDRALQSSPSVSPEVEKAAKLLSKSLVEKKWENVETALSSLFQAYPAKEPLAWNTLIREFLRAWETKHVNWTTAQKRDGLETVLGKFGSNPDALYPKLQSLFKSWSASAVSTGDLTEGEIPEIEEKPVVKKPGELKTREDISDAMRDLLAQALSIGMVSLLSRAPDLSQEAVRLSKKTREAFDANSVSSLTSNLKQFWFKLEIRAGDEAEIHEGLLRLLRLVVDNISEIVVEDQYLQGQSGVVKEIISKPIRLGVLDDAERSIKAVIYKQSALKHSISEAKSSLKNLISSFIDRLGEFSESTGDYHNKITAYSERLRKCDDVAQFTSILDEVLSGTKAIQIDTLRSREGILYAQNKVNEANQRIIELEAELENLSELVREDQLTRTLNRRGMEQAFEREVSRSKRRNSPLCIAVLDIDNFKQLNDTLGHQAGDDALVHLATVIKETVRPNDVVARFGGEEFLIILPDSEINDALQAVTRLQRELTKKIFLHKNEKRVITFSAGVALMAPNETQHSLIKRADEAMYQAKKSGKNRVVPALSVKSGT